MRVFAGLVMAVLCALPLAAGAAAPQRTFVASNGVDANPCSLVAPCRTFGTAVAAVAVGGEVIVLDSAGYGVVTIAKYDGTSGVIVTRNNKTVTGNGTDTQGTPYTPTSGI